ncbi:MAG: hypothetical protein BM485_04515 [Desulfobulbaceae bacterium DB1]|nr:MAG: hypothetical protein BM485_04515 [Desulfobulbaceae bacterium DB1]
MHYFFCYINKSRSSNFFFCLPVRFTMKQFGLKTLTLIISLTAYLCSFPGLGNAGIVCIGEDGHVAIESTATPSLPVHSATETSHGPGIEQENHCEEECRSCIDFPLSFTTAVQHICQNKFEFTLEKNPLYRSQSDMPHIAAAYSDHPSPPAKKPVIDQSITSLRTTVLLI